MKIEILDTNSELFNKDDIFKETYNGLLNIINEIIDWDKSEFPKKVNLLQDEPEIIENREFLGNPPKLVPGIMFIYKKQQLVFIDENTIGLINSETGIFGFYRVINSFILPEYKLRQSKNIVNAMQPSFQVLTIIDEIRDWLRTPLLNIEELTIGLPSAEEISKCELNILSNIKLPSGINELILKEFNIEDIQKFVPYIKFSIKSELDLFNDTNLIFNSQTGKIYYNKGEVIDSTYVKMEILSTISHLIKKD